MTTVTDLNTGAEPNLIHKFFLPVKWRDGIHAIWNMSLKLSWINPVHIIGQVMLFVQLGDLHVHVQFGVVDNLAVLVLIGTSIIVTFVKGIFPMEPLIVPIRCHPVAIISD